MDVSMVLINRELLYCSSDISEGMGKPIPPMRLGRDHSFLSMLFEIMVVEDDLDEAIDSLVQWIEQLFYAWDGSHKVGKLVYETLHKTAISCLWLCLCDACEFP